MSAMNIMPYVAPSSIGVCCGNQDQRLERTFQYERNWEMGRATEHIRQTDGREEMRLINAAGAISTRPHPVSQCVSCQPIAPLPYISRRRSGLVWAPQQPAVPSRPLHYLLITRVLPNSLSLSLSLTSLPIVIFPATKMTATNKHFTQTATSALTLVRSHVPSKISLT